MAEIQVLDKTTTETLMEESNLAEQRLYDLDVSDVEFATESKLRLTVNMVRTNTPPDPCEVSEEDFLSCLSTYEDNHMTGGWYNFGDDDEDEEIVCMASGSAMEPVIHVCCCPPETDDADDNGTFNDDAIPCVTPEMWMRYNGPIDGTLPKTGMMIRTRLSTDANTWGWGFIIDEEEQLIKLYKFEGVSIQDGELMGTTSSLHGALGNGQGWYFFYAWVFGSEEWWGAPNESWVDVYFQNTRNGGSGVDLIERDNQPIWWATTAASIPYMGADGGVEMVLWGLDSGDHAVAEWMGLSAGCGHCYELTGASGPELPLVIDESCTLSYL